MGTELRTKFCSGVNIITPVTTSAISMKVITQTQFGNDNTKAITNFSCPAIFTFGSNIASG
jgi:hypothetical protein